MKNAADENPWTETVATVIACDDDSNYPGNFRRDGALKIPKFAVQFTYPTNGNSYAGQYTSRVPVPLGHKFTIFVRSLGSQQNTGSEMSDSPGRAKLRALLMMAAVVLWVVFRAIDS